MSYDSDVVSATSGETDWDKIIKLCDRIRESYGPSAMGSALGAVMRRIKNNDYNVQLQALTLLEACVSNCGKDFQLELTKSTFHSQVKEILLNRAGSIGQKSIQMFKGLLVTWSSDYRNDRTMSGLVKFVDQLVSEGLIVVQGGVTGSALGNTTQSQTTASTTEEDDIQKAIRLSLEESKTTNNSTISMYPSFSPPQQNKKESIGKKVRALYDFEAVEDNELTFKAGEIITVTNDSDDKWWRGETQLGNGLFPVNFVSTNLNATPEPVVKTKSSSKVANNGDSVNKKVAINEPQVDLLLEMLKTADITSTNKEENKTLKSLEVECAHMKIMAEKEIESYQRQLDQMAEVSEKLQESFRFYRKLLQDGPRLSEKQSQIVQQQQYSTHSHEVPPPYQTDGSYFVPPPPPDGGFQTLPPQPSIAYTQSYVPSLYGQPSIPQYIPNHGHGPYNGQQQQLPPPPPQQQPLPYQPWSNGGTGNPSQLSSSPLSTYQPMSQPLM